MDKKIVIFGASSSGLVKLRLNLIQEFKKLNYAVIACAPVDDYNQIARDIFEPWGVKFVALKLKKSKISLFSDLFTIVNLYQVLTANNPDIVLFYNIKPVIYGSIVAKLAGVPNIYSGITGLGTIFIGNQIKIKILRILIKILYKVSLSFNRQVFFQNPDDLELFVKEKLINRNRAVLTNGSGVDIDYFVTNTLPRDAIFMLVARLIKDKGIHEYISACKILKSRYSGVNFYLVGDLDSNPTSLSAKELKSLIDEKIVDYIKGTDDIRDVIKKASVFVLPSYREGTSRSVLEAMSMGRPIITTDAPGCRETVIDGVNGYLVPVKNVEALTAAMERFILRPEIIAPMGKESRRIAVEKFDVNKVNKIILEAMGMLS